MKPKLILMVGIFIAGICWAGNGFAACVHDPSGYWTLDQVSPPFINEMLDEFAGTCAGAECPVSDANGQVGAALEFNGTDEGVSIADSGDAIFDFENSESFSISVWFRRRVFASWSNNEVLVGRYASGQVHFWVGLENNTGRASFRLWDNVVFGDLSQGAVTGTANVADGSWHHIVAVRDAVAGEIALYVDGVQAQSSPMIYTGTFTADSSLDIGWMEGQYYFNGSIDEVTIFDEALSGDAVAAMFAAGDAGNPICTDNLPPQISSTAPTTATVGVEYTYTPTAEDPDGDVLEWSLENAPEGMNIDAASGTITWTPAEGTTTSGLVTLSVFDGIDGTDTEEITITVEGSEPGPGPDPEPEPEPNPDNGDDSSGGDSGGGCFIHTSAGGINSWLLGSAGLMALLALILPVGLVEKK